MQKRSQSLDEMSSYTHVCTYKHSYTHPCACAYVHACRSAWQTETNTGTIKCQSTVTIISEHVHTATVLGIHEVGSLDLGSALSGIK